MKWLNPGFAEIFDVKYGKVSTYLKANTTSSVLNGDALKALNMTQADSVLCLNEGNNTTYIQKNFTDFSIKEVWVSFDAYLRSYFVRCTIYFGNNLPSLLLDSDGYLILRDASGKAIYKSTITYQKENLNIEIHLKVGSEGRIDVWIDTKLAISYRSPSAFADVDISYFRISKESDANSYNLNLFLTHFIIQDTRRIGLEKFKKLTIDPDTEQNMPQGSTTTYKLSGLSDATEFSDITSVCAVLQATSRDANITTGTFSLNGNEIGTIDVSDSSGKAYEIAHSETNGTTGKSWTAADIEGKTLSFKVNGAE